MATQDATGSAVRSVAVVRESSSGDWYAFRQAVIRDVAYEEFVATRVRPIHRRIARALERCAGAEGVSLDDLAYHSWLARDAVRGRGYDELLANGRSLFLRKHRHESTTRGRVSSPLRFPSNIAACRASSWV